VTDTRLRKMFWFDYDFQKQEQWLNEMAAKGQNPIPSIDWLGLPTYRIESGEPGEWVYRIEILPKDAKKASSREYLAFMSDAGAETVAATARLAYFRKRSADGPFEIYSDLESRIAYHRRVRTSLSWLIAFELYMIPLEAVYLIPPQPIPALVPFQIAVLLLLVPGIVMTVLKRRQISALIGELESQQQVFE
jgi:hypothetical protein